MSKSNRNSGKQWTTQEVQQIKHLVSQSTSTRIIGLKLGRTEEAIYSKASEKDILLKSTNQSPYNRK